ncbi:hypothetical protein BFV94_2109 [Alteromonas macleodii]|uniref:Uncharacterized protein n=1 Tax=Alteromonas macleodii TaxID=28108 RepID=A0AB36FS95_ALTMA|nr:hypothetical protein BFV95_2110 [Alteromonas macleodii]OES32170.1 hypothetical protein BFV94_2109 [Alteromonas macleodii]OES32364.1 hypothetical protein BFV93_2101 [Alteromonas macleodii]OES41247.1 hypothetical protein BFV96_2096 [Alteromonas macleodii]
MFVQAKVAKPILACVFLQKNDCSELFGVQLFAKLAASL